MKIIFRPLVLLLICIIFPPALFAQQKAYDYVINDVLIYDGQSLRGQYGDVGVSGNKIAAIGELDLGEAAKIVEGYGLALSPGFIDAHTHSDFNGFIYSNLANKLMQGVTTEVVGNCGMSAAPVMGEHRQNIRGVWAREGVALPARGYEWETFREYSSALMHQGMKSNVIALAGHGNIRSSVMGFEAREASPEELAKMKELLENAMAEGAHGISFGLIYLPGIYASEGEVRELCAVASGKGGVCAFHMRSEGARLVESVKEVIGIARDTNAKVQISHLKAGGKSNWHKIDEVIALIEAAREEGLKIMADVYPYTASFAELGVVLPDKIYQAPDRLAMFKDPERRQVLLNELREYYKANPRDWDTVLVASAEGDGFESYSGKRIGEISRDSQLSPEEVLVTILAGTDFKASAFSFSQSQDTISKLFQTSFAVAGSDSIADGSRFPHPRAYGTFPHVLEKFVRTDKMLSVGEAIRKMSGQTAEQFGITDRGMIRIGYYADFVLLDLKQVGQAATYDKPKQMSRGVSWVFLNGVPVIEEGKYTGLNKGEFLFRQD